MVRPVFKAKDDKNQHLANELNRFLEDMLPDGARKLDAQIEAGFCSMLTNQRPGKRTIQ